MTLNEMSDASLLQLRDEIDTELKRRAMANTASPAPSRQPGEKIYRNPWNQWQTWKGKGRRPKWLREYINQGGNPNDLLQ